jgi:hypothetical protein
MTAHKLPIFTAASDDDRDTIPCPPPSWEA